MKNKFMFVSLSVLLANGMNIEVADYHKHLIPHHTTLRVDFKDETDVKITTKIPLNTSTCPILNFKIDNTPNLSSLTSIAAFLYKENEIASFFVLDNK